ncbi:MAG: peptidoglycan-binding protein [Planctomycetota bacterium]
MDGRLGRQTHLAIDAFQRAKGLETGGLTIRTLAALGVKVGPQ